MLSIARKYNQVYIFRWQPHTFGATDPADPLKHQAVIQQVIPTRTGLNGIKSTVVVWLSEVNGSEPRSAPKVIRLSDLRENNTDTS